MNLLLWRHAEAEEADEGDSAALDLVRPLTTRGQRDARHIAHWLDKFLPGKTHILVSPALRAQQTVHTLKRRFVTVDALAPGRSVEELLAAAQWPEAKAPVLIVGHQPTLGLAAAWLLGAQGRGAAPTQGWAMRKGAVWWLRRRVRHGAAEVVMVSVRAPGDLF